MSKNLRIYHTVLGSYYNTLCNMIRKNIEEGGDWLWLHDRITGRTLNASDFEILSKKFAVFFKNLGLEKGDVIHLVVGNYNESYGAIGGIWILGGVASCGDVALDDKAIAGQVISLLGFSFSWQNCPDRFTATVLPRFALYETRDTFPARGK